MASKRVKAYRKTNKGKKSEYFYYKFMIDGELHGPLCTYLTDQREADRVAQNAYDEARGEAVKIKRDAAKIRNRPKDMSLNQLCVSYWTRHVEPKDLKDKGQIGTQLHVIIDTIGAETMVLAIDDDVVERFCSARRAVISVRTKGKLSANSRNNQLMRLQNILNHARVVEKIETHVINWERFKVAKNKLNARPKRYVTPEESTLIFSEMRPDYRPIFEMENATGLRRHSLVNLTWDQVDEANGAIVIKQNGDRDHLVVITPDITAILEEQRPYKTSRDGAVFTFIADATMANNKTGKAYVKGQRYPVTYWGLGSYWKGLIRRLPIPHVRLHDFRGTFTSDYVMSAGLSHASAAAGHSSEQVTGAALQDHPVSGSPARGSYRSESAARNGLFRDPPRCRFCTSNCTPRKK